MALVLGTSYIELSVGEFQLFIRVMVPDKVKNLFSIPYFYVLFEILTALSSLQSFTNL